MGSTKLLITLHTSSKNPTCQCRRHKRHRFNLWVRKIPWCNNPLQYSCLENPIDRVAWQATVHRLTESRTQLKRLSMHAQHSEVKWENCSKKPPVPKGILTFYPISPPSPEMSLSLGESLRTRFPGIPPNVLSPSLFPYGCRIALAESQRILQETDIRQTLDLPTTTHRHGYVLILWVKNCTMHPRTLCNL